MKKKLVLWGANAQDEKVLIALELLDEANKVIVTTFPNESVSDDFYGKMMNEWRDNKGEVEFPEGHTSVESELSMSDSLLPEHLKTDRTDLIQRAQTEWHFIVLSNKLNKVYQDELADLKEKVSSLTDFDKGMWENLKGFWGKVQSQVKERNLFRDHANELREGTNQLFEEMKGLRTKLNKEFESNSEKVYAEFNEKIDDIHKRIEGGNHRFAAVFDELKKIQQSYKTSPLTGKHRNSLWDRIDGAFKAAKKERFGAEGVSNSPTDRFSKRLTGLESARKRMQDTIRRDERELEFQQSRIDSTFGQLEAQMRQAKLSMIEQRLKSKREKFDDIVKTYEKVKEQHAKATAKEAKRKAAEEEKQKIAAAKAAAKAEIAQNLASSTIAEAAESTPTEPVAESTTETVAKTVAAAAATAAVVETATETTTETVTEEVTETIAEAAGESESALQAVANILSESVEDVIDSAKAIAVIAKAKAEEAVSEAVKKANEMVDDYVEAKEEAKEATAETAEEVVVEATEAATEPVEIVVDAVENTTEVVEEVVVEVIEPTETAADIVTDVKEEVEDKSDDVA